MTQRRQREERIENNIEDEIEYGIRRSRRGTLWIYRDSGSLTPAHKISLGNG